MKFTGCNKIELNFILWKKASWDINTGAATTKLVLEDVPGISYPYYMGNKQPGKDKKPPKKHMDKVSE